MGRADNLPPSKDALREWQLARLRTLIAHAQANSSFYARSLSGVDPASIRSLDDFSRLQTVSPDDLREQPERFLCVSQDDIARVVTLQSSGTTGQPKRVFYTRDDLEATADYFDWGMRNLVGPGQTALVLMPGERPGGVGRLLVDALSRSGARAVAHGALENAAAGVDHLLAEKASCIVGPPAHVHLLAREWERRRLPAGTVRSVLLCWDAVPDALADNVERIFGCRVFRHWGMIETGLGGAVECAPGSGLHLREADVFLEVVDPETGSLVPDGEFGEMVVTSVLKLGMPLIRYRTGDRGRILPGPCRCGSPLRRLDPHVRRLADSVAVATGLLRLEELNETLYAVEGLGDFSARLSGRTLHVLVCGGNGVGERAECALASLPVIALGVTENVLQIDIEMKNDAAPAFPGLGKRRIVIDREL
jgi:phenylacetate-coenzyme A ligase PaaK-like adenylate-forming protein